MKRRLLSLAAAFLAALAIVGCAGIDGGTSLQISQDSLTEAGVTVTLERATAMPVDHGYDYSFDITIENASDEDVMQVVYGIVTYGTDGEEIRSFGHVYDEETSAIAPGETVREHLDSRWGKAEPASVALGSLTVVPASEMPAAHLPQTGEYLYQALGDEKLANIKSEPPVSLTFHIDQGGAGSTATFTPGAGLDEAIDLLCKIKIGNDGAESVSDNYNGIYLTWADGTHTSISLSLRNLEFVAHRNRYHTYTLDDLDPFWNFAAAHAIPDVEGE